MPRSRNISGVYHTAKPSVNISGIMHNDSNRFNNIGGVWRKSYQALSVGDTVSFGGLNWICVSINASGQAGLVCKISVYARYFSTFANPASWYNSDLRAWLNSTFYNTFSAADKAKIISETNRNYYDTYANPTFPASVDNVRILKASELFGIGATYSTGTTIDEGAQLSCFATTAQRLNFFFGGSVGSAMPVWTMSSRTPNTNAYMVFVINTDGTLFYGNGNTDTYRTFPYILIQP